MAADANNSREWCCTKWSLTFIGGKQRHNSKLLYQEKVVDYNKEDTMPHSKNYLPVLKFSEPWREDTLKGVLKIHSRKIRTRQIRKPQANKFININEK